LFLVVNEYCVSEPVFSKSGFDVNKELFISKCRPEHDKFIQKHKKKRKHRVLAYAKEIMAQLEKLKFEYVPKKENLLNIPQLRPIENFLKT
jgi:predicted RNA-binding protein with EMAP domain